MTTALVIRSTLGSLFASSALPHLRALSSLLSSYGRVLCLRLDAGYERAFVYYDSAASSQAALDALPSRVPHLRAAAAPVVVLVEGLVVSSTVPLIEEYVYSCFSRFGAVLGVDVDVDAGEVRVYMQEQEPAERARLALHKTKVNAWIWRVSLTDDVPQSGTAEPSSSTSTPSPSAAIDVLPREVLLLIFSYLPPRGLLLALRLVSRKWSRIASHAIKSLASFSEIACVRLLRDPILTSQFRHLTHFTVSNATSAALANKRNEWRASLRSLTLCHTSAVLPQFLSLDRITAITSLIPLSQFSLQAMAHSLVRLSLNLFNTAGDEGLALLHVPLLPNLSSLSVAAMQEDTRTEGLQSFLFRQRTTLTDLEILIHDHSPASYLPVHFPRLARLVLDVDENDDTLDWLNAHFTSLRHLSLRCNEASVQRLSLDLLTSLRALHVRDADPLDACNLSQFLEPCVNLRHHTSTFKVESSKAISSRLYSLTLNEAIPGIERSFTALRELKVMGWSTTAHTMHLPHLETLRWLGHDRSLRSIELLERLINAFPTLRRLSFLLDGADLMTEFPLVRDHLGVHAPRLIRIEESLKLAENNGMLRVALPVLGTGKLPSEWRVRLTDMQRSLRWMDLLSFDVTEITDEDALGEVYSALRAYTHSGSSR